MTRNEAIAALDAYHKAQLEVIKYIDASANDVTDRLLALDHSNECWDTLIKCVRESWEEDQVK